MTQAKQVTGGRALVARGGEIVTVSSAGGMVTAATVAAEVAAAEEFALKEKSASTLRAYDADWRVFKAWCAARGQPPRPADPRVVATFLAAQAKAGKKVSTLTRRLAAIRYEHRQEGFETPTTSEHVAKVLTGIRRDRGAATQKKAPATAEVITNMLARCPDSIQGQRDRALLGLGFAGALRRSELVALTVDDLVFEPLGLRVRIKRSKTDQAAIGQHIVVPAVGALGIVAAVRAWLDAAQIAAGPIFRPINRHGQVLPDALSGTSVAAIVKSYAKTAGYDSALFSGHSLRRGFLTSAAHAGATIAKMKEVSRHKSTDVLMGYVSEAELFKDHAGSAFL